MKIVVLDGHTLNPGDLSWSGLENLGVCTVHDRTPPDLVVERARGAAIVLTNKTIINADTIAQLPDLQYLGVLATGYNVVDIEAARRRGIPVTNVPAYSTRSVAQATFALLLELAQHTGHHARTVRDGRWCASLDFCYADTPLVELDGLTMGLIGYGSIARMVAEIARSFGMRVIACRQSDKATGDATRLADLESLLRESDVVSLHCPLTADNHNLLDARRLALLKPGALLINTARGPLIDEQALADALDAGQLAGAGLDVLAVEPARPDNPLLQARNCLITPHIAWATGAARRRLMDQVVANVRAFLDGSPTNVVNR